MSGKWVYRRPEVYWEAQRRPKVDQTSASIDITTPLNTPSKLIYGQEQYYTGSLRKRHLAYMYQKHLISVPQAGVLNTQGVSGGIDNTQLTGALQTDYIIFPVPYTDNLEERIPVTHRSRRPHAAFTSQKKAFYRDTSVQYNQSLGGTFGGTTTLPTIVNTTVAINPGGPSIAINKPAGGAVGDVYVMFVYHEEVTSIPGVSCSGFSVLEGPDGPFTYNFGAGNKQIWASVLTRQHNGSEGSTFTVTATAGAVEPICALLRGVDLTATPIFSTIAGTSGGSVNTVTCNGLTTAVDNCLGLMFWADVSGSIGTVTASGWSNHDTNQETVLFTKSLVTAGAEGSVAVNWTGTATPASEAWMFAFAPVPVAGIIGAMTPVYVPAATEVITPRAFEQYQRILTPRRHAAFMYQKKLNGVQATGAVYGLSLSGIFL